METLKESGELKGLPGQLVTIIYVDRVTPSFYILYFELKTFTVGKTVKHRARKGLIDLYLLGL